MKYLSGLFLTLVLVFTLSGCTHFHLYQPTIQQGNIVTQEQIARLKMGMSKQQVLAILGDPVLNNSLNPDQLSYIYTLQKNGGQITEKALILGFSNNRLTSIKNYYH